MKFNYMHNMNIVFNQGLSFPEGGECEWGWVGPRFLNDAIATKVSRAHHW